MALKEFLTNKWFRFIIQAVFTTVGFMLLVWQVHEQGLNMGNNVWNARLFAFLAFFIISFGWAFAGSTSANKIKRFLGSYSILVTAWFLIGGIFITNDAMQGTNTTGGNAWIAFDTMMGIGREFLFIVQGIVIAVPVGILIFTVMSVFHADTSDDIQSAVIEGGLALAFLIAYAWMGSTFGWFI